MGGYGVRSDDQYPAGMVAFPGDVDLESEQDETLDKDHQENGEERDSQGKTGNGRIRAKSKGQCRGQEDPDTGRADQAGYLSGETPLLGADIESE